MTVKMEELTERKVESYALVIMEGTIVWIIEEISLLARKAASSLYACVILMCSTW